MTGQRLRVDWPACEARGLCHELAPELIELDPWGYPILVGDPTTHQETRLAQEAVAGCPRRALRLVGD